MSHPAPIRRACVLLRASSHYRSDQFRAGLRRHGFEVEQRWSARPGPGDLLLLWNRRRGHETIAAAYERAGARVLVAENGYLPHPGARKGFALALSQHNGAGRWYVGDSPRFEVEDQPWRPRGDHVLVLPQRGIGAHGVAMPTGWPLGIQRRLAGLTDRPIVFRRHPGAENSEPYDQLRGAHCAVTWASGAGLKAICAGIPVFHEMERWIGGIASSRLAGDIESCFMPDRSVLWHRLSWAQWSLEEIGSGEAFDGLLNVEDRDLFRTQ